MFSSILGGTLTIGNFAICLSVALALGFVVAFMHMKTTKSNKNFVTTLFVLPALVTTVILLVNGNLGTSVAVLGAFSLVRFRSIPGNSKEILSVFFAMAIGLAVGVGYIGFAAIFTIAISLIVALLSIFNFGQSTRNTKMLKILIPEDLDYTEVFNDIFNDYVDSSDMVSAKTVNMGSIFELTYRVDLKNNINEKEFIDKLRVRNGNLKISLSHPLTDQEL
ncbi:MAG: DUF4956 domain-containing protein [Firmicutes bacterium]|nr:DUF4956 domain-containing protein [Bacillota bacterium]